MKKIVQISAIPKVLDDVNRQKGAPETLYMLAEDGTVLRLREGDDAAKILVMPSDAE